MNIKKSTFVFIAIGAILSCATFSKTKDLATKEQDIVRDTISNDKAEIQNLTESTPEKSYKETESLQIEQNDEYDLDSRDLKLGSEVKEMFEFTDEEDSLDSSSYVNIFMEDTTLNVAADKVETAQIAQQADEQTLINQVNKPIIGYEMPTAKQLTKRLEELNKNTFMDFEYNKYVYNHLNFYLRRKPEIVPEILGRASQYFPMIEKTLDKYDLPYELKYLAVIESALKPYAGSRAGAKGLWQFMYWTAKYNGLKINTLVDERFDPVKSTESACKFLSTLYKKYNDWYLVLAAYNSGPGNVNKAIYRSGGKRNYWQIRRYLPRETRGYVPSFIAVAYIFNNYKKHNVTPLEYPISYFDLDTIHVREKVKFKDLAEFFQISIKELKEFNTQYRHEIIPGSKEAPNEVYLAQTHIKSFIDKEKDFYVYVDSLNKNRKIEIPKNIYGGKRKIRYRVRTGDVLGSIAKRFRVYVSSIKRWNNLRSSRIRVGQRLTIYSSRSRSVASRKKPKKVYKNLKNYTWIEIKTGDTLWEIAQKYKGVSVSDLMHINGIKNSSSIKPGTKIKVPKA